MTVDDTADFIVVGAGPAGCAVAARLADAPGAPSVLLVEAGPATPSKLTRVPLGIAALVPFRGRHNYAYQTVPQAQLDGRKGYVPRGRGVGGSSLINAMICTRGQPQDYDGWAALGCTGWSWRDVLPLFRRIEDYQHGADAWHGVGGPLPVSDLRSPSPLSRAFVEAAVQCGYPRNQDFNGPRQEGVGLYQVFQRDGRRLDAGRAYLGEPPSHRRNLRVLAGQPAQRILFEGQRASGVQVGGRNLRARREVLLCAGAFGSPQLLMLSGMGPAAHLREHGIRVLHDAPDVGEHLQDHIDYTVNLRVHAKGLFGLHPLALARIAASIGAFRARGEGMLTSNAAEAGGFVKSDASLDRPDLQLHFCVGMVDNHNRRMHLATGLALHVCVLRPHSRGHVRLAGSHVATAPLIDPNFLSAPEDLQLLLRGARIARRILAAPALAAYGGRPLHAGGEDEAELQALIRAHADTIYHPVGTCRMGSDARAVVDPQLRVRGVQGLRVADASIMPTLISGNTEAPSAMIGEKAAALVLATSA